MDLWEQMDKNDEIYCESYHDTKNFDFLHNGVTIICRTHDAHAENPLLRNRSWIERRNPQEKKDGIVSDEKVSEVSLDDLLSNLEEKFHSFKPKNFCALRVMRFETVVAETIVVLSILLSNRTGTWVLRQYAILF